MNFSGNRCKNHDFYYKIVLAAVKQDFSKLKYVDKTCEHYREIVLAAVEVSFCAFEYVDKTCEHYREIAIAAIELNFHAFKYVDKTCEHYREIASAAVKQNYCALRYVSKNIRLNMILDFFDNDINNLYLIKDCIGFDDVISIKNILSKEKYKYDYKEILNFFSYKNLNSRATEIKFDQTSMCLNGKLPKNLQEINKKYDGLCDIICNLLLFKDVLGKSDKTLLEKTITIEELSKNLIVKSHFLKINSVFRKIIAFLFGIYQKNIFSIKDQWNLVKTIK